MPAQAALSGFPLAVLPPLVAAVAVLVTGTWILRRERNSTIGRQFFLATLSLDIWLWALVALLVTKDPGPALIWGRLGYLGVPFIPAALLNAIVAISTAPPRYFKGTTRLVWIIAAVFSAEAIFSDRFVSGVEQFSWGYYPHYGPSAAFFLLF